MIEELMKSLLMAAVIIFAVLAIAFRSVRVGLISIMPNIMPLAATGALRMSIDHTLGIASACSFAICLGIAVDDTIHYLIQFRAERREGLNPLQANQKAFVSVGSALIMTTLVMVAGLGTVLTSQLPPHVSFAAMGCTTLAAALVADLIFLPALLTLFPGKLDVTQPDSSSVSPSDNT
ncbi:MAG: MMPL family transporter [Planctomycetaceae bacterium]